jgi:RNA polymerase sigma-70 factor, ECF subfamily
MTQSRHDELIAQLLASHQQRLSGYVRTLVPNRADAEELLQEINLTIWRSGTKFQPGTNFAAWSYEIARRFVLNSYKQRPRGLRFSDALLEQLGATAATESDLASARLDALEHCLRKLSAKDQHLIRMRYEPGTTTQSLAARSGRSLRGLYQSLNRIRTALLECIQRTLARERRG